MIARLEGALRELAPTRIVVDVGGVGYEVHIPLSTFAELPDEGKDVALHIHTHAREGAIQLFGFHSAGERAAFELLLRKMAERILVELRERGDELAAVVSPAEAGTAAPDGEATVREQTLSALVNLGYPKAQAERVLVGAEEETGPGANIETLVRVSLRRLAK